MARYPVVESNEFLRSSKILSRHSSMSLSSRIYYRSSGAAGFPFTWEMLPGEPKDKQHINDDGETRPPLSPPPALHSLSFPKPSIQHYFENKKKSSSPSKLLFKLWNKMGRRMSKMSQSSDYCINNDAEKVVRVEDFGFGSSADSCKATSDYSSRSLSPCSSTTEDSSNVSSRKPFAPPTSWSISRMVVACASATKRG